jgi:hypothetical protein
MTYTTAENQVEPGRDNFSQLGRKPAVRHFRAEDLLEMSDLKSSAAALDYSDVDPDQFLILKQIRILQDYTKRQTCTAKSDICTVTFFNIFSILGCLVLVVRPWMFWLS